MNQRINLDDSIQNKTSSTCVAWFKLSELITRKEKEKALALYRLLSHSFDDEAYRLQVEGDILWSLEDEQALEKYTQAAFLYQKEKQLVSSVAIYEHLLTLQPENYDFLYNLLIFYAFLDWKERFESRYLIVLNLFNKDIFNEEQVFDLNKKIIDKVFGFLDFFDSSIEYGDGSSAQKWIFVSMNSFLEKRNLNLKERVKTYCLERNLKFDS